MDQVNVWYLVLGCVLIFVGLTISYFDRLPITTAIAYFAVGVLLGPSGLGAVHYDLVRNAHVLEHVTELVVIVSLFTAGLKLRQPWRHPLWRPGLRLATGSLLLTIVCLAVLARYALRVPWGVGILLGGILAPTDPVLASGVQVRDPEDRDRLRFALTGEAAFNDGTAFPLVMLGVGLMGVTVDAGFALRWLWWDVLFASASGLLIGWTLGSVTAAFVLRIRARNQDAAVLDDFLSLGLIALAYGAALFANTYGFLSVFAAGLAMRKISTQPTIGRAVLSFTEQVERLGEVFVVIFLGAMLRWPTAHARDLWIVPVLFLVVRPFAVFLGLKGSTMDPFEKRMIAWFGIRGIGSIYYLTYAIGRGIPPEYAERLASLTYWAVTASVVAHGLTDWPLAKLYGTKLASDRRASS